MIYVSPTKFKINNISNPLEILINVNVSPSMRNQGLIYNILLFNPGRNLDE